MNSICVAVLEDNARERKVLTDALERYSKEKGVLFDVKYYERAEDFIYKKSNNVDILFLDVELPGNMNGMEAAEKFRKLNEDAILIFVTNMRKYVIKGYEVGALNYILKPLNYSGLAATLDRAIRLIDRYRPIPVMIRTSDGFRMVDCRNIYYVEVMKHDVRFKTSEGMISNYGTLVQWEEKLSPYDFVRCSACALVNLRHVKGVSGDEVTVGGKTFKISRTKKKAFLQKIAEYYGDTE